MKIYITSDDYDMLSTAPEGVANLRAVRTSPTRNRVCFIASPWHPISETPLPNKELLLYSSTYDCFKIEWYNGTDDEALPAAVTHWAYLDDNKP